VTIRRWLASATAAAAVVGCSGLAEKAAKDSGAAEARPRGIETGAGSLLAIGEAAYAESEYDSARVVLERALRLAADSGDSTGYARALTSLGLTAWRQGRYSDAKSLGERALQLKLRLGLGGDLFRSYNALGLLANSEARTGDAVALFQDARNAARRAADSSGVAKASGNLGLALMEMGEFESARQGFETLRDVAASLDDIRSEAAALTNLGLLDIRLGDPRRAIPTLERARELHRKSGHAVGEENALGQLGSAYGEMGDLQRAIVYLDSALSTARRFGLREAESDDLQLLAEVFVELGDHRRALEYLGQAQSVSVALGQKGRLGNIARSEAKSYAAIGRDDLAWSRAQHAHSLHRGAGAPMEQMFDRLLLAELAQRSGRRDDADVMLREGGRLARHLDVPIARAYMRLGQARIADMRGDSRATLGMLNLSRADLSRLGPSGEAEVLALQSRALAREGRLEEAARTGRLAIDAVEQIRGRITSGPLRASYTSERSAIYGEQILNLLQLGRESEAFAVADAARSRALLEHIAEGRRTSGVGSDRLAQAERLLRQIDWLIERLQQADTVPERERSGSEHASINVLSSRLSEARREYENLMQHGLVENARKAALLGDGVTDLRQVQETLAGDEALLQYFAGPERLITFVVRRDTVLALTVRIDAADLTTRVRLAHDIASTSRDSAAPGTPLRSLHALLIEPVAMRGLLRDTRRLIIVPHAALAHVPFAALIDRDGRYLVQDHAVMSLPSAAALKELRANSPAGDNRTAVFAPFPQRLPATRVEADVVSRRAGGGLRLFGNAADETAVREALARYSIVHIASHGIMNENSPMFSRIELASRAGAAPSNDGRLEVHELLGIRLRSRLVFLSGCETAAATAWSNSFRRGQDYATLAQAFLYAGARDVIATLWRIDDRGAAAFADNFYRELRTRDPVDALAEAQRAAMRSGSYASPKHWAGYTLTGAGLGPPSKAGHASVQY
jgi:CHAT domain-containing protein/tetratricopeptide (TPR) repeat protein